MDKSPQKYIAPEQKCMPAKIMTIIEKKKTPSPPKKEKKEQDSSHSPKQGVKNKIQTHEKFKRMLRIQALGGHYEAEQETQL